MNPYIWLGVAAVMAVVEGLSQVLVTVWFVVGGIAAFVAGLLGGGIVAQIVAFLVVSLACLALFRPLAMKHRRIGAAHEPTPVGSGARVVERISAGAQTGRVETPDHMTWAALSASGEDIEEGAQVRVVEQRSVRLVVERT